jgi:hypothetical protein
MPRRWIDRALIAGGVVLAGVIAASALSSLSFGGHGTRAPSTVAESVPVKPVVTAVGSATSAAAPTSIVVGNSDIELHGSPETEFLRRCALDRVGVDVARGQRLVLRYSGPPCQMPQLALVAEVRGPGGKVVNRRPALGRSGLPSILGGREVVVSGPLAPGLLRCWAGRPLGLRVVDDGRLLRGTIPCRGQR